jgi:predicted ATP-dependent endonuclease of OLD family
MTSFFEKVVLEHIGCIKSTEIALTPIHALIGPNDSGKTTALHAVRLALQARSSGFQKEAESWIPFDPKRSLLGETSQITLAADSASYATRFRNDGIACSLQSNGVEKPDSDSHGSWTQRRPTRAPFERFENDDGTKKSVAITLADGTPVPAKLMSEGMLYFLAFLIVEQLDPAFFLVEEPENGLHPTRIAEVMSILREMSKTSHVLLATHSPLVVNELDASEVTVLRRTPENGATATTLSKTADFERRSEIYATGELWLNVVDRMKRVIAMDSRAKD